MLIPFRGKLWVVCDFCMKTGSDDTMMSKHTHAVICDSCIKNPTGLHYVNEPDPAVDTPKAAQSGEPM